MSVVTQNEPETGDLTPTFDWMAPRYESQTDAVSWGRYDGWLRDLMTIAEGFSPRRVVDLGCGTGRLLEKLYRRHPDWDLVGVDAAAHMLDEITVPVNRVHARLQEWAPRHPREFDLALMSFVLRDQADPGDALRAVHQALKPGGHLAVLETHTPKGWAGRGFEAYFYQWLPRWGDWSLTKDWPYRPEEAPYRWLARSHRRWHRGDQMPTWLKEAGFRNVETRRPVSDVVMVWTAEA
ncbi:MAG: methyltransferase domain-containing protein [Sulfobacillus sp.]|nr:methyltransferase domain-containing protein [Sulfobacillus sp.]